MPARLFVLFGRRASRAAQHPATLGSSALPNVMRAAAAAALAVAVGATAASAQVGPLPIGWRALHGSSHDYVIGTDLPRRDGGQGLPGATIRSVADAPNGPAAIGQSIQAAAYRGKRVRLSGSLRLSAVDSSSTTVLWMRVDGGGRVQVADFMDDRALRGTTGWTPATIVLDVPADAIGITYGVMLDGNGQVWFDAAKLEVVGADVSPTGREIEFVPQPAAIAAHRVATTRKAQEAAYRRALAEPVNLALATINRSHR
jgi:hypothetical protein